MTVAAGGTSHRTCQYFSDHSFNDAVHIDDDTSIRAIVIGVAFYDGRTMILVSYMHNGNLNEHWIDELRLSLAPDA